jgi:hypothetical protein
MNLKAKNVINDYQKEKPKTKKGQAPIEAEECRRLEQYREYKKEKATQDN